ncbi:hypothetical protein GPECTOR_30g209 [Gonium pectorale]|uniref:Uncharacterized protein n=1 Tax=Gonium pectorale TaxID=33097 RepID=A0A150GE51_GONPE|nr:hypothetical protein GPECTOR_30g209 [Gonium pectorale]|eukprot:KXZ48114.1 hypothetical protein GPECTOR_30g209 [Gonium pectorale]
MTQGSEDVEDPNGVDGIFGRVLALTRSWKSFASASSISLSRRYHDANGGLAEDEEGRWVRRSTTRSGDGANGGGSGDGGDEATEQCQPGGDSNAGVGEAAHLAAVDEAA